MLTDQTALRVAGSLKRVEEAKDHVLEQSAYTAAPGVVEDYLVRITEHQVNVNMAIQELSELEPEPQPLVEPESGKTPEQLQDDFEAEHFTQETGSVPPKDE